MIQVEFVQDLFIKIAKTGAKWMLWNIGSEKKVDTAAKEDMKEKRKSLLFVIY
jgi:hypothetical protein